MKNLQEYKAVFFRERRRVLVIVIAGTVLAAIVAFLWPSTYTARTTLLPPTEEETGYNVSSLIRGISLPGVRFPSRTGPEEVAVSVLESRRVKGGIVDTLLLVEHYREANRNEAIRQLETNTSAEIDENGLVTISVRDRVPEMAAKIANQYARELDAFNRAVRMTKGRRLRIFVEQRLEETRAQMTAAETALQEYQSQHSTVAISPEQMSSVESGSQLIARQVGLRIRLGMVGEYASEGSEEVRLLQRELDAVNRQVALLPDIGLELARRLRDLRIQEQVYALLSAQYEEARINETRDVATLDVLDVAEAPDRRSWPRRGLLIGLGFLTSLFGAAAWVVYRSWAGL